MSEIKMDYPKEKFQFAQMEDKLHDKKLETKPIGYFKDAFIRFCKNKSSVVAAIIILILFLFAMLVPIFGETKYTKALTDTDYLLYKKLLPKSDLLSSIGIWDGTKSETLSYNNFNYYNAIGIETGCNPIAKIKKGPYEMNSASGKSKYYDVKTDSYYKNGMYYMNLTAETYQSIMKWQDENKIQVIYPAVEMPADTQSSFKADANYWYAFDKKGNPVLDDQGNFIPIYKQTGEDEYTSIMRIPSDPYLAGDTENAYRYAIIIGTESTPTYRVRVFLYNYFIYKYGYEPSFLFGTNNSGQDIFTRLASGARFSFLLSIFVSIINLTIGAIYGAIEGYFGGAVDLIMERISDILSGVPFIVVATLFQLHMVNRVGPVVSLLFAFVLTGWIGMASTVRTQFYRYKNQEYILAARVLGAKHKRIMFKHIFPNALGTIITSCVLVIPGVIFSESSLTYLGIVNLESSTMTSVGTLLAGGQEFLSTYPHIILFPALFISLLMVSFNLFGNGLRDAFNPSLRGVE